MSRNLKTAIICICVSVAVIAAGLFTLYKCFVTPERILQLAFIQTGKNITQSFDIFSINEKELIDDMRERGLRTELSFTAENIPLIDGKEISVTSDSDTVCSVTEFDMNGVSLLAYKDKERLLINTPLFDGGFEIPMAELSKEWNESIFKDIIEVSQQYTGKNALSDFVRGKFEFGVYAQPISAIFSDITEKNPVEKKGSTVVMTGSKTRYANAYTIKVTKEDAERFLLAVPADYAAGVENSPERTKEIQKYFKSLADDYEITIKVLKNEIREIEIKNSDGETKTIALKGEKNPFDIIEFYKNGDTKSSVRRVHTRSGGSVYEKIYLSDKEIFSLENNANDIKLRFDNDIVNIDMNAYGKNVTEDSIYLSDIELSINETFNISGQCMVSEKYDRDFSFEKSGRYINILDISEEEWEIVTNSLLGLEK